MNHHPLSCKDIPEQPILRLLVANKGHWTLWDSWDTWDIPSQRRVFAPGIRTAMPKDIPFNLALAKMRNLERRGFISGCTCGCRGDFTITEKGEEHLMSTNPEPDALTTVEQISKAIDDYRPAQLDMIRLMAAERGLDPENLTALDYKRLLIEEAEFSQQVAERASPEERDENKPYADDLLRIAARIVT